MKLDQLFETTIRKFVPFEKKKTGYADHEEWVGGTSVVSFDSKTWTFTGKAGKNAKTGELSFEFANKDDGDARIWVTSSGQVVKD